MKKSIFIGFLLFSSLLAVNAQNDQNSTFNNVAIGLKDPDWGVNIKTNFPSYTGGWQRGFFVSNETGGQHFLSVFAKGQSVNGVSSLINSSIGKDFSNPYITFLPNGNVGVGTEKPSGKLEISGNSGVYSDFASYSGTTTNNYLPNGKEPTLIISENLAGTFTPAVGGQITYRGGLSFGKGGPGIYSINPNPAGSGYYGEIRFHTTYWNGSDYNNADRMVIKLDGNVGIGTTNPDAKLTVNGNIHAKEVKIDLLSPMTVPDYVFTASYKLRTLKEVEEYIKQNNHLPEIPSAKEIEKNGLMLAEMNMSLLKKMEEMTLYMIEQEKKNNLQSKEIDEQNKKINTLIKENESFKTLSERFSRIENQLKINN